MLRRNSKLVRRALVATGRDEAPLPEIVQIESTNICNATCVFCPRDEMARKQGGSRRPKLILSFVRQNNSDDERAFIEHWRARADKIHITDLHNWAGTLNQRSEVTYPCYRPWLTFTALWDGRVSLCCADF